MTAEDILSQIDHALEDWAISGDAMRWRPGEDAALETAKKHIVVGTLYINGEAVGQIRDAIILGPMA